MVILALLLLPARLIEEANPDWRLTSWLLALIVAAIGLLGAALMGGSPWVRHFGLVLCLPLTAVPWPMRFEQLLVQSLMRLVATVTVEIINAFGIAAVRQGNLIRIPTGVVGIDEACSGIRSLQATLLIAIAVGQLFRLSFTRRLWLLAVGAAVAFVTNVARTIFLVSVGAARGISAIARWHDPAGFTVTAICLLALLVIALRLSRGDVASRPQLDANTLQKPIRVLPAKALAAVCLWLFISEAATEAWYRAHEHRLIERPSWQVDWARENNMVTTLPISDSTRAMLRFNTAQSAAWHDKFGLRWWGFFARWERGRAALQLVRSHSPEICLPAIGRTFERELPPIKVDHDGVQLLFRVYQFEQEVKPLFVFVCIQEDKFLPSDSSSIASVWSTRGRLLAALSGRRNLGQRLLELAVSGLSSAAEAEKALRNTVREIVK